MATRRYAIQHSTEYFAAGRVASTGMQVLLGIQAKEILCLYFSDEGEFNTLETRVIPERSTADTAGDMMTAWMSELGATPATIHVGKFSIPARAIAIRDLPDYLQDFVEDPSKSEDERRESLSKYLASWRKSGDFVLVWDEDYEMNAQGEVVST